jgi:hypothetical protein
MTNEISEIYEVRKWLEAAIGNAGGELGTEFGSGDLGNGPEANCQLVLNGKTYNINITEEEATAE